MGVGGVLGLVIALVVGFVTPFVLPSEIRKMYERDGKESGVSGWTGLWATLGLLILVGPIVWFVKVQGALNRYWRGQSRMTITIVPRAEWGAARPKRRTSAGARPAGRRRRPLVRDPARGPYARRLPGAPPPRPAGAPERPEGALRRHRLQPRRLPARRRLRAARLRRPGRRERLRRREPLARRDRLHGRHRRPAHRAPASERSTGLIHAWQDQGAGLDVQPHSNFVKTSLPRAGGHRLAAAEAEAVGAPAEAAATDETPGLAARLGLLAARGGRRPRHAPARSPGAHPRLRLGGGLAHPPDRQPDGPAGALPRLARVAGSAARKPADRPSSLPAKIPRLVAARPQRIERLDQPTTLI